MKRIVKEVENILYLCGFFGRHERVDLVSLELVMPGDEEETKQIDSLYEMVRKNNLPGFLALQTRMWDLDHKIDHFNKDQFYLIDNKITQAVTAAKWYRRIFIDKRIPKDVLKETMVEKRSLILLRKDVDKCIDFLREPSLSYPITSDQYDFIIKSNSSRYGQINQSLIELEATTFDQMKLRKSRIENIFF